MKLRILISLIFLISTTFASVHEVEHITCEHEASSCQVCVVNDNLNSADISSDVSSLLYLSFDEISFTKQLLSRRQNRTTNHSNAPPKNS